MNPFDDFIINALLKTDGNGIVIQAENEQLEFKESFYSGQKNNFDSRKRRHN